MTPSGQMALLTDPPLRMGSFTSTPTVQPSGDTDDQCSFPDTTLEQFQARSASDRLCSSTTEVWI